MNYVQKNPLPIPEMGTHHSVPVQMDTIFDWEYALKAQQLMALYEKGKAGTWNATDLNWDQEVSIEKLLANRRAMSGGQSPFNRLLNPPVELSEDQITEFNLNMNAWMLSQFLHGEQGALVATAKIVQTVPNEEAKFYAANQVADEARHVEAYHRYLTEKLGVSYPVNTELGKILDATCSDSRWDVTYLGMQIMVEGLALAAFGMIKLMMMDEPLIQDITTRIMQDEARHVAFGVISLQDLYTHGALTPQEMREREDFIIECTYLMRDRLLMGQVYQRFGWDEDLWLKWAVTTPFMAAFRQLLFSKIVPNLRRIGLLTPRVRDAYEKIGILKYEHEKDSTEELLSAPPKEFLELIANMSGGQQAAPLQ